MWMRVAFVAWRSLSSSYKPCDYILKPFVAQCPFYRVAVEYVMFSLERHEAEDNEMSCFVSSLLYFDGECRQKAGLEVSQGYEGA